MSKIFDKLLKKRGLDDDFVHPKYESLPTPNFLPDIKLAVNRIKTAVAKQEKVLIFGDYDADGITASVAMHDALKLAGLENVEIILPDRFKDGYGMNERIVERAVDGECSLVITVDCGSNNAEIIAELNRHRIDTIVTDHHECLGELPEAVAVVNPKREPKNVFYDLAGVGVVFMVARALVEVGLIKDGQEKWLLDLVVIGTICDSMRLTQVNRCLTFWGMKVLVKTRRFGLQALVQKIGLRKINSDAVGFMIGPRINAAGRVKSPNVALDLLMTKSHVEALALAEELEELNTQRKQQQDKATQEIVKKGVGSWPVIVAVGEWSEGILGIIAGHLMEEYHKPTFVLTKKGDVYKGSGRSFGDFNLAQALKECQDCIVGGGGHAGACGIKVSTDKIEDFRKAINDYYRSLGLSQQDKNLDREADVETDSLTDFNCELIEELSQLEPYGEGNETPVWLAKHTIVAMTRKVGKDLKHLQIVIRDKDSKTLKLVAFNAPEEWLDLEENTNIDVWFTLVENEWEGIKNAEGRIIKIGVVE